MFKYHDFVKTLSDRFRSHCESIQAHYNYEYGNAFEVAVATSLELSLPTSFGVARGYVVNELGETAGDDIVIFERSRFPTLTANGRSDLARKEYIPVEAVYSYVEAKHTVNLFGADPQSLAKAMEQVGRVKAVCDSRPKRGPNKIAPYFTVGGPFSVTIPNEFPQVTNPSHGIILARQVREKKGGKILSDPDTIISHLSNIELPWNSTPDLIVLGENVVVLPVLPAQGNNTVRAPFFLPDRSLYQAAKVRGVGFGIAILWLLQALDWIQLDVMPWHRLIVDAFEIPLAE